MSAMNARGEVTAVRVASPPQPPFDDAALAAARKLRFEPAQQGGQPIAVRIQYAFNFVERPAAAPREPAVAPVNLAGLVRERGTRRKLSGIEVTAAGESALTDAQGRFELHAILQDAPVEIVIAAPG